MTPMIHSARDIVCLDSSSECGLDTRFPGLIIMSSKSYLFVVKKCPDKHAGKYRALINYRRRDGARRFEIVRITTPAGKSVRAACIGHYDAPNVIKIDYDLRAALDLKPDEETPLEIVKCGLFGSLLWYLSAQDPIIRVPAVLAAISVGLGLLSVVLAIL